MKRTIKLRVVNLVFTKRGILLFIKGSLVRFLWPRRIQNDARELAVSRLVILVASLCLISGLLGVIDGPIPYFFNPPIFQSDLRDIHEKMDEDLVTIGLTVLVIDVANRWRDVQQYKKQLIRDLGRWDHSVALNASRELEMRGWLRDGSLRKAVLFGTILNEAKLSAADLREANLSEAILSDADLSDANLSKVRLIRANLRRADLSDADLSDANLRDAELEGAQLWRISYLQGDTVVKMLGRLPQHMDGWWETQTKLDGAILPDGSQWTRDTDMERFTNPEHEEYWNSNVRWSLASQIDNGYEGRDDKDE